MPKPRNTKIPAAKTEKLPGKEAIFMLLPWSSKHHSSHSDIEAYVAATGDWETLAEIHDAAGIDAEVLSSFIVRVVNNYEKNQGLIDQMASALELCLSCEGKLTWEAEHEAQVVLARARQEI